MARTPAYRSLGTAGDPTRARDSKATGRALESGTQVYETTADSTGAGDLDIPISITGNVLGWWSTPIAGSGATQPLQWRREPTSRTIYAATPSAGEWRVTVLYRRL